jgi:hypothetical protein
MAGKQIKFTVTAEAVAYLRWFARNILFEGSEHDAARHLMMRQLEETRRKHRKEEPSTDDLASMRPTDEGDGGGEK